jgi:hypothetical protein
MDMIGHQHVGMYRATMSVCCLLQPSQEAQIIAVISKDRLAVVASNYDMLWITGEYEPGWSGHWTSLSVAGILSVVFRYSSSKSSETDPFDLCRFRA